MSGLYKHTVRSRLSGAGIPESKRAIPAWSLRSGNAFASLLIRVAALRDLIARSSGNVVEASI